MVLDSCQKRHQGLVQKLEIAANLNLNLKYDIHLKLKRRKTYVYN